MVEEDLLHLKLELAVALDNIHLQMVMLEVEEDFLEVEEENSDDTNVTNRDIDPMNVLRMRGQTK